MDPLLRAAVDRRDREQGIAKEAEQLQADQDRMRMLDRTAFPRCLNCGGGLREDNKADYCTRSKECRRLKRRTER